MDGGMNEQLKKQQQQQIQVTQQETQTVQQTQQVSQSAYATAEAQDTKVISDMIKENPYLQKENDADPAAPDPNAEEILKTQHIIGNGKAKAIQAAEKKAGEQ